MFIAFSNLLCPVDFINMLFAPSEKVSLCEWMVLLFSLQCSYADACWWRLWVSLEHLLIGNRSEQLTVASSAQNPCSYTLIIILQIQLSVPVKCSCNLSSELKWIDIFCQKSSFGLIWYNCDMFQWSCTSTQFSLVNQMLLTVCISEPPQRDHWL